MTEKDFDQAVDAIARSFNPREFDMFLYLKLGYRRENFVPNAAFRILVTDVLMDFDNKAELPFLIAAVAAERPLRRDVQEVYRKLVRNLISMTRRGEIEEKVLRAYERYGLPAPRVDLQTEGVAQGTLLATQTDEGFERQVNRLIPTLRVEELRKQLFRFQGRVCRIEVGGAAEGTGFLVGPAAVLTNYHVIERAARTPESVRVACRFDYRVWEGAAHPDAVLIELPAANTWLLAHSPSLPDATEQAAFDTPGADLLSHLDFALLRLPHSIGDKPVVSDATSDPARGWIPVPPAPPAIRKADSPPPRPPLMILHHGGGGPLELDLDTAGLIGLNANGSRVRYTTTTAEGASGSPCLEMDWSLIALHHFGDPGKNPKYNQGIPIHLIRNCLKGEALAALGGPPP